jgi:DNA-directed RNA polymerase specialized sigma24 family protein
MIPSAARAAHEEQATACLEAAKKHRLNLLAVAVRLAGSQEGGMDLFQQTCLNCHDAIQRNGFAGGRYEFYLLASIKNLHYKTRKQRREVALPDDYEVAEPAAPAASGQAQLAEQLMQEVRVHFSPAERVVLRLHVDGLTTRQIAEAIGQGHHLNVWRAITRMKDHLRITFRQAWDGLVE